MLPVRPLRRAFALVALVLLVTSLAANAPLYDPDEGLHAAIAQEMVTTGNYVTPTFLGTPFLDKPILFFWAEAASLRLLGMDETAVRVPPLLFALLGMISVALLGRALAGESAGLVAGIAYATMLLPLGVSEVAVHDVALAPFLCLACWCVVRVADGMPLPLGIAVAGVSLGLSILTKGLVACVFTVLFAAALVAARLTQAGTGVGEPTRASAGATIGRLVVMLGGAGVIAILVAAPWYLAMERAHPGYLHYYFVERHLQGYLTATQPHSGRGWYSICRSSSAARCHGRSIWLGRRGRRWRTAATRFARSSGRCGRGSSSACSFSALASPSW